MFAKLTGILGHCRDIAAHLIELANKGMDVNQGILDKAHAMVAVAEKFIPEQEKAPTTILLPVPETHAAALGAVALPVK
jgi:hypothetical protein